MANGGRNIVDYIIGSHVVWQGATHLEVIIDDTRYCTMGGDSGHMLLRLRLSIDCSFVEPQHTIVTKNFLPRFKYDQSKVEEYQFSLTTSLGNLWVVESIGHLGVDMLADLLQQCVGVAIESTFGSKLSGGSCKERHHHKPWFDVDYCTTKRELKLWLKISPDLDTAKHQESKLKNLLKRKRIIWDSARFQHMCAFAKVDALSLWTKYRPRAPVMEKINAVTLLEGLCELVGQSPPPIQLRTNHFTQVTVPPPSHTLNTDITLVELLQVLKKLQRNKVAGLDGMKVEFILDAGELLHMPLLTSFKLLSSGRLSRSPFH